MITLDIIALSALTATVFVHILLTVWRCGLKIRVPLFRRLRMVRHVRLVARIRDMSPSLEVKAACDDLLHALVK